jgi:hypothetical protein
MKKLIFILCGLFFITPLFSQNDECANAISLTLNGTCSSGNVAGATQSLPALCSGQADEDIWYSIIAPSNGELTIDVKVSAGFDAAIEMFDGCGGTLVDCKDAKSDGIDEQMITTGLTAGNTYLIRVFDYNTGTPPTTTFNICASGSAGPGPPANDECLGAIPLTLNPICNFISGSVAGATQSPQTACSGVADNDVWYSVVAPASGKFTVQVNGSSGFDVVLELFDGCSGQLLECRDNTGAGSNEQINATGLTPGSTYLLRVYDYNPGIPATTSFDICVTPFSGVPANDECDNAVGITPQAACINIQGDVAGATESLAGGCSGNPDDDVWYVFDGVANREYTITVNGSAGFNSVVEVFYSSSDCSTKSSFDCVDATSAGNAEKIQFGAIGGTYYIRVYDAGTGAPATTTFDICVTYKLNDNCDDAWYLSAGDCLAGDVTSATQSLPGCNGVADDDVWYFFEADMTSEEITVTGSSSFDAVVELFGGCSSTSLYCTNSTSAGGIEKIIANGLIPGNTYSIRVYHAGAGLPVNPTFLICLTHPNNDECSSAIPLNVNLTCDNNYTLGDAANATASPYPSCAGNADQDVWYSVVAPANGNLTINVNGYGTFNPVVQVFNSCSGSSLYCKDDFSGGGTPETIDATGLTPGSTYYIRVYHYSGLSSNTTFEICVSGALNDECSNALEILASGSMCYSEVAASFKGSTPSQSNSSNDVWFKFEAVTSHANINISDYNGAHFVGVYDACNGNYIGGQSFNTNPSSTYIGGLQPGKDYYVQVGKGSGISSTEEFSICIYTPAPVNSDCSQAISLSSGTNTCTYTSGGVEGSFYGNTAACSGNANDEVWYKFVASGADQTISVDGSSQFNPVIELLDALCFSSPNIQCSNIPGDGGTATLNATGLTPGNTYYIGVFDFDADTAATTGFDICVYLIPVASIQSQFDLNSSVFPNPASSTLTLTLENISGQVMSINLINTEGQIIYSNNELRSAANYHDIINTEKIPNGLYLLQMIINDEIVNKKVVIKH